jgi:hypothetical protein
MPSPGGRSPGMASHENHYGRVGWAGCGIPPTSPRATTHQPGGRALRRMLRFYQGGCPRAGVCSDQPRAPPAGLSSGMVPGPGREGGGSPGGVGIPSRRRQRRSGSAGQTSRSFIPRVLHLDVCPADPLRDKLADATGYPLPTSLLRQANIPRVPGGAITSGPPRSTAEPCNSAWPPIEVPDGAVGRSLQS